MLPSFTTFSPLLLPSIIRIFLTFVPHPLLPPCFLFLRIYSTPSPLFRLRRANGSSSCSAARPNRTRVGGANHLTKAAGPPK